MRIFGVAFLGENFLAKPIGQHADRFFCRLGDPIERGQQLRELGLSSGELTLEIERVRAAGLDLELAAEPVGHRRQEFERGRHEVFDAGAPIQIEDGAIADQEGPKSQRDIDAEIAAASAATRPEQIGVLDGVADEPFARGDDDLGGEIDLRRVACACPSGTEGTAQCNYGRYCATLSVRGQDVGTTLIGEGLAEPYVCTKTSCPPRKDWCRS